MKGKAFGGGLLQKQKYWSLFPLGLGPEDLGPQEDVFRGPWQVFEKFLTVPLKSKSGEYLNTNAKKKMALKEAYTKIGTLFFLLIPNISDFFEINKIDHIDVGDGFWRMLVTTVMMSPLKL